MKNFILLLFIVCAAPGFSQKLKFTENKHNFGYLQKGEIDTMSYHFTNDGDAPLVITDAKVECNCTKVDFPKEPIAPGGSGVVMIIYDSKGAYGLQDRVVTIISNSKKGEEKLHFKGEVLQKKKIGF
jgi:hypothetical protein